MHVKNCQNFVLFEISYFRLKFLTKMTKNWHLFKKLVTKTFLKSGRVLIDLSLLSNFSQTYDICILHAKK